jgi:hypothetical protein
MTIIGYILVVLSAFWFAFKLYVSFTTEGGALGMTPVLAGAVFPPAMALLGVGLVIISSMRTGQRQPLATSDWLMFGLMWAGSVFAAGVLIVWAGKPGKKAHKRRRERDQ